MNLPYRKMYGMTTFVLIIVLLCSALAGAAGLSPGGEPEDAVNGLDDSSSDLREESEPGAVAS